jgi:hypothetical protein
MAQVCEAGAMLEREADPDHIPAHTTAEGPGPFASVTPRHTVDYLLVGLQQQMVVLTGQADLKGSIIITASSIVLSISATQFGDTELRWSLVTLLFFVLLALLSSILAVFPKFHIHPEPGDRLPAGFSPFFFGHFSQITKERHVDLMADVLRDDGMTYRVMVEDVYEQGVYLLKSKYRFLRFSYASFLIGFLAASIQLTITVIVS